MASDTSDRISKNQFIAGNNEAISLPRDWITVQLHRAAQGLPPIGDFRQMLYLQSPPGYGKTSFIKSLVHDLNSNDPLLRGKIVLLETVLAAHENPSDIMGTSFPITLPVDNSAWESSTEESDKSRYGVSGIGSESLPIKHTVQTWTPILRQLDSAMSRGKIVLWFFDEFNNINTQWETNILKLSEGRFKEWELPNRFVLVGAGNPPDQSIHKSDFGESLKSRLYRVQFIPDYSQWRKHMLAEGQRPENYAIRLIVADFIEVNRHYFLTSSSVKRDPHQLGHIATNPRSWTLAADSLARLFRHNASPPTNEQVKWTLERRIPASITPEFTRFFETYTKHITARLFQSSRSFISIPPLPSSYQFRLPPVPIPTPAVGARDGQTKQNDDWDEYKRATAFQQAMEQRIQKCVTDHFAKDIQQHELVHNNVLSYLIDSLEQPSSFRPIPYLVSKPGVGKTSFVSGIINTANNLIAEQRSRLNNGTEPVSSEVQKELDRLKDFVLLEVVLPSIPTVGDLTGAVLPFPMDEKNSETAESDTLNTPQFRVRSPGNEDLPKRHSVTAWTWFTRKIDELTRQGKQVVVFFDELSNISPEWEAVFLKMVEGKVGTWQLPPSVVFLAAGNFAHQSAFSRKFKEPMQARLEFMEYTPHFGKWAQYMLRPDLPLNDYLARFGVVDFLSKNPQFFNPSENDGQEKAISSLAPREWTLSAKWIRRLSDYYGRHLDEEELALYLAPRLSDSMAQKLASHLKSGDVWRQAHSVWNAHSLDRQLTAGIAGETPNRTPSGTITPQPKGQSDIKTDMSVFDEFRARSAEVATKVDRIKESIANDGSKKSEQYDLMRNDEKSHFYMKAAVKAYLLETPPPEGEFCDIIYLESPPGYGKTSFCKGIISELNESLQEEKFELIEINLASFNQSEVIGTQFPIIVDGHQKPDTPRDSGVHSPGNETLPQRDMVTTWTGFTRRLHECLKKGKTPVVFIDEMSNISQQWEAVLLKLSESKISSNWKINGPVRFIAAGNPPEDSKAGRHFKDAFNARLYRIPFRPSFIECTRRLKNDTPDVFHKFAADAIIDYLLLYPDQFVPQRGQVTSQNRLLSPRNWTLAASHYAEVLGLEARRCKLSPDDFKNPDDLRALSVNQDKLTEWLKGLLPAHAVNGFVAFASLNSIVTGDEIILQGKQVPSNLTPEQVKVIVHSVTASLARNVAGAEKEAEIGIGGATIRTASVEIISNTRKGDSEKFAQRVREENEQEIRFAKKLGRYIVNFMNFVDSIGDNLASRQQLDSLLMPNLDHLVPVLSSTHRLIDRVGIFVDKEFNKEFSDAVFEKNDFINASSRLFKLFSYIYESIHPTTSSASKSSAHGNQSAPGSSKTPKTTPFLTTPVTPPSTPSSPQPPRHQFPGYGIS